MSRWPQPSFGRLARAAAVFACLTPRPAAAQAELQGRVLADSGRSLIANAEISIPRLQLRARSDSAGRYRLERVPAGEHLVVSRAPGFKPDTLLVEFAENETIVKDVLLELRMTALEEVQVEVPSTPMLRGQLAGYEDRRARGIGHFFDQAVFDSTRQSRLGDVISGRVPGVTIARGNGSRAWATSGRATSVANCELMCKVSKSDILDKYDMATGAPLACYMDVYLDGVMMYSSASRQVMPIFNLNNIDSRTVRAVEVYASPSQIPPQYVRMGAKCGLMLIWTRSAR